MSASAASSCLALSSMARAPSATAPAADTHAARAVGAVAQANPICIPVLDADAREVDTELVGQHLGEHRGVPHAEVLGAYRGDYVASRIDLNLRQLGPGRRRSFLTKVESPSPRRRPRAADSARRREN